MASTISNAEKDEMREQVHNLATSKPSAVSSVVVDVTLNQQRWLSVGITLQQVVTPVLRTYINQQLSAIYQKLEQNHALSLQTCQCHLKQLPNSNRMLDYKNINGNGKIAVPRNFNYAVRSHEEFAKLFLRAFMVHFSVIDERCDLSALLLLITNVDDTSFTHKLRNAAKEVRDIRNSWAHCDFNAWDENKLRNCYRAMRNFIQCLSLPSAVESNVMTSLLHWEQKGGDYFAPGRVPEDVVLATLEQTKLLANYILTSESWTKESMDSMEGCLLKIDSSMMTLSEEIKILSGDQEEQKHRLKAIEQNVSAKILDLSEEHKQTRDVSEHAVTATRDLQKNLESVKAKQKLTMETLATTQETFGARVETVEHLQERIKEDIQRVTAHLEARILTPEIHSNIYFPQKNEWFTGRSHELNQLYSFLSDNSKGSQTVALFGLGGSGKTSLAIQYAYQRKVFYPGGIMWVSADREAQFEDSIASIARDFGVVDTDFKTTYHRLLKWLQGIKERWLMVVDNVDQEDLPQHLAMLLTGSWKDHVCGHVLVTTRRSQIEIEEIFSKPDMENLEVRCFSEQDGLEFIKKRTKRSYHPAMLDLLEELGFLPLAVEQAAAYLLTRGQCTIPQYVEAYRELRLKHIRKKYARAPAVVCSKERLAVHTTYRMNFDYISHESEETGLGSTALIIMKVAAYLSPDNIPTEVINAGEPHVADDELAAALRMPTTRAEVLAILTRFSLFRMNQDRTITVHRLVQEVMQYDDSKSERQFYIECGMRMLHFAFRDTVCPNDVLDRGESGGDLNVWGNLARSACTLRDHLLEHVKTVEDDKITKNVEFAHLSYSAAIFLSINQRQADAFKAQIDKNTAMASMTELDGENCKYLHLIKIPILEWDRKLLQAKMSIALEDTLAEGTDTMKVAEMQNNLGLLAVKECRFPDGIRHISRAIMAATNDGQVPAHFFSVRSMCYNRVGDFENALSDAEKCIEIDSNSWEGHHWRAKALANLHGQRGASFCYCAGLVSASVAAYLHPPCNLQHSIKVYYPIVVYRLIKDSEDLSNSISDVLAWKHTTFMLKQGHYSIPLVPAKSLHLVGIEDGVFLTVTNLQYYPKKNVVLHFENVSFPETCAGLNVRGDATVSFYRCNFSNGEKACDDYPYCKGGKGCRGRSSVSCEELAKKNHPKDHTYTSFVGYSGEPAILVHEGARTEVVKCKIDGAGGVGILLCGKQSSARITDSVITTCRGSGLNLVVGADVEAIGNVFENNRIHGVNINAWVPESFRTGSTSCFLKENVIKGNGIEGVMSGGYWTTDGKSLGTLQPVSLHVSDNIISHNGKSGVSLENGNVTVTGNKIFENWAWGVILSHGLPLSRIIGNEIYKNKCGALRVDENCTASVFIDRNTIHDHMGPAVYVDDWHGMSDRSEADQKIVFGENVLRDNDTGIQHPVSESQRRGGNQCSQCGRASPEVKRCTGCRKAMYCNANCQKNHWPGHKRTCKILQKEYSVVLDMKKDKVELFPNQPGFTSVTWKVYHPTLQGIGDGPKPNPCNTRRFIIKIQNYGEYSSDGEQSILGLYDQSTSVEFNFRSEKLYHILNECGVLGRNMLTGKKIYCWANFEKNGKKIRIHIDELAPVQTW